jgi:DNA-binding FadR family transcriptional regulator
MLLTIFFVNMLIKPIWNGSMKPHERAIQNLEKILGSVAPQMRLPSERALATKLDVSRTVLREVLDRLEAEGKVWRHVGQGTFAGRRPQQTAKMLSLITAHTSPAEVLEARLAIEPQIARMAATRASEIQISELRALINKGHAANDAATWELWDSQFHRAICTICGNRLMLSIFDGFNAMRRQAKWSALRTSVLTAELRQAYVVQHHAIVDAIAARNPAAAQAAMTAHIEQVARDLFGTSK